MKQELGIDNLELYNIIQKLVSKLAKSACYVHYLQTAGL